MFLFTIGTQLDGTQLDMLNSLDAKLQEIQDSQAGSPQIDRCQAFVNDIDGQVAITLCYEWELSKTCITSVSSSFNSALSDLQYQVIKIFKVDQTDLPF